MPSPNEQTSALAPSTPKKRLSPPKNVRWQHAPAGNDIKRTNVPNIRVQFRHDVLEAEKRLIRQGVEQATAKGRVLHVS